MKTQNSTPLAMFHEDIWVLIGNNARATYPAFKVNQAIMSVLRSGEVPGFQATSDFQSVEPQLTPTSNQKAYALLVYSAALKFQKCLNKHQIFDFGNTIYHLKND